MFARPLSGKTTRWLAIAGICLALPALAATALKTDTAKSKVSIVFKQLNLSLIHI